MINANSRNFYPTCPTFVLEESIARANQFNALCFSLQAITCLKRAHYLSPMAFLPAYNLGMVLLTTGQPASAAVYLCAAVSADPSNPMSYLLLGRKHYWDKVTTRRFSCYHLCSLASGAGRNSCGLHVSNEPRSDFHWLLYRNVLCV